MKAGPLFHKEIIRHSSGCRHSQTLYNEHRRCAACNAKKGCGSRYYLGSQPLPGLWDAAQVATWGMVLLEGSLSVGLWLGYRRLLRVLVPLAIVFHALLYGFVSVYTFSATMYLGIFACLDPEDVEAALHSLLGQAQPETKENKNAEEKKDD